LTGCTLAQCSFKLNDENSMPVRSRAYPFSASDRAELENQMRQMESDGFISNSLSSCSSSTVLVTKRDGSKRVVVDMRKMNSLLQDKVFHSHTLQEIINKIRNFRSRYFSLIDLRSTFNQIVISNESRMYTAFSSSLGKYEFNRLPFGKSFQGPYLLTR
jgi:hypothetical protein